MLVHWGRALEIDGKSSQLFISPPSFMLPIYKMGLPQATVEVSWENLHMQHTQRPVHCRGLRDSCLVFTSH